MLSLFLFFPMLNSLPKTSSKRSLHTFLLGRISSHTPPPADNTIVLLFVVKTQQAATIQDRRSAKLSFFDGRHFGTPNKGIRRSELKLQCQAPVLDS